jgi:hypothetical protein
MTRAPLALTMLSMSMRLISLLALCSLPAGCRGGNVIAIGIFVAIVIVAAIRNGVSLSHEKCPHCGHAGATPTFHEKGFVDYVTCDHCGKEL